MPNKNIEKNKEIELEKKIFPILAINNSNLKPYIEFFDYYPENVTQKPLGILAGFFEVREYSEDSAYIVNFLNSVLKKEYFLNPKRNVPESFDSSLHKINIALSEIAKHGNVNWLGKIDSTICVFEKNTLHFTTTGNAKILLWRKDILTDITESLAEEPELHPLKTFTNVSSGRLEKDDKIILASADIFNLLSLSDIQKSLSRLDNDKFKQFLKTAIGNELDIAGTVVIEITEKNKPVINENSSKNENEPEILNAFSGNSFNKENFKKNNTKILDAAENFTSVEQNEYTDTKTGHIYIQGDDEEKNDSSPWSENAQILKESLNNIAHSFYSIILKKFLFIWKKILITSSELKINIFSFIKKNINNYKAAKNNDLSEKSSDEKNYFNETHLNRPFFESIYSLIFKLKFWLKKTRVRIKLIYLKNIPEIPAIRRIKHSFLKLSFKQKILAICLVLIMIISPIITNLVKKEKPLKQSNPIQEQPQPPSEKELYSKETNIQFIDQVEKISALNAIIKIFYTTDGIFAVSENSLLSDKDNFTKKYTWPEEYGKCKNATYMDDLNLIFILNEKNEIIEFSTVSKNFKKSIFSFPLNSEIGPIHTYLTYLYVVDKKENQVYRYPRAEGGFGEKINWLKEPTELSWAISMTIDENLYLSGKTDIKRFFNGKKSEFQTESSFTKIQFDQIYSSVENSSIFVLDKENSRIIIFDKEGRIKKQYHHESIGYSKDFTIDEENEKAYIITDSEINSLQLN